MEAKQSAQINSKIQLSRAPIVVVLGHVDHGKTTLLDTIRKTSVTEKEAGGITQHIGAYQIQLITKNKEQRTITFIDTPGHEAFGKMRSRGASVADIALLVVAADDGVMPQTLESLKFIQAAQIPYIVVINKIDVPTADLQKTKQQLATHGILVEGFGGDISVAPVSAKKGTGILELLELIILVSEMKGIHGSPTGILEAVVVETNREKKRGIIATVIVKNGVIRRSDTVYTDTTICRVKALFDDKGQTVLEAMAGMPVQIMGWENIPHVGSVVSTKETLKQTDEETAQTAGKQMVLPPLITTKKLNVVLKGDAAGSLEAIKENLTELVEIIHSEASAITESDVQLAKVTNAVIIGFNVFPSSQVQRFARLEGVRMKSYKIIYELLNEIAEVVRILNEPESSEETLGEAHIIAEFPFQGARVAGSKIISDRLSRGDLIRILRQEEEIGRARIKSIRQGKNDVPKVEKGVECGVLFDKKLDFQIGDRIIAYKIKEILA